MEKQDDVLRQLSLDERLYILRRRDGRTLVEIADAVNALLPDDDQISGDLVNRLERGKSAKADTVRMLALADVYDVPPELLDIGPEALDRMKELLTSTR